MLKRDCLSFTEVTHRRETMHVKEVTLWVFSLTNQEEASGFVLQLWFSSHHSPPVSWYCQLSPNWLIPLLEEACLKASASSCVHTCGTCVIPLLGLTFLLLLTGQNCSFNLGSGGRRASRAADRGKKLILHPWTSYFTCFGNSCKY